MPGISIVAVIQERNQHSVEKLRRRQLRDASDPLSCPSEIFIRYYRLNKDAFVMVLKKISPYLKKSTIPAILQLANTLRFVGTGSFQGVIAKDVDISLGRSTVSTMLWITINAIEDVICPHWIKLQMSTEDKRNSKAHFFSKYQIPGIVGCIDGTHVKVCKPSEDESLFLNRKGTFSLNAMIICDYKMKIKAVDACRPGSCHDSFIWNLSSARNYFESNYSRGDKNSWLLGDSGYGFEPFLITPYRNVIAGTMQHKFNKKHSSARNIVERTIGVLKSRFRCMQGTLSYSPEKVIKIINVCCALHNICREYNVELDEIATFNENDDGSDEMEDNFDSNLYTLAKRLRDNMALQIN